MLGKLLSRITQKAPSQKDVDPVSTGAQEPIAYHSRFGGLWIDRLDWREQMVARHLSDEQQGQVTRFVEDGFLILKGAAPEALVDAFQRRIEASFRHGRADVLYQNNSTQETAWLTSPQDRMGGRVLDSFVPFKEALDLFSVPPLLDFLSLIMDADPLLFQSLSFDQGSQQGLHQDTAYVVVDEPLRLAACWIALEDVTPGSGELMYAPGSHRLPDWDFGSGNKHWNPQDDGDAAHHSWAKHLAQSAKESPRGIERFLAKKGDILIWHADLAHGGSAITDPKLTRQSLVGHFCPQTTKPYFFSTHPHLDTVRKHGRLGYCSQHYDLR